MDSTQTHQANADFWNEITDSYAERDEAKAIEFLRTGGNYLFDSERQTLGDLASWCGRAIHLQCSHGNDALSLLRQGAAEVVGVDISDALLTVARRKAEALGASARFVCADVIHSPHDLDGTADLVYTGKGALCWMMDIDAWAQVVARLLKPGGRFFIHESHPLDWVWDMSAQAYVLDHEYGDYFSPKMRERLFVRATNATPRYRQWTLGQVINAVIDAGLAVTRLVELPEPFWAQFPNIPADMLGRLPHSFTLTARKPI